MKDELQMYKNYLYALREKEKYGNQYGDTDEIIKMYENDLNIKKEPTPNKFEEVSTDIIKLIDSLHYDDIEKEIVRLNIQYVLCKMTMTKQQFEEDTQTLDRQRRR